MSVLFRRFPPLRIRAEVLRMVRSPRDLYFSPLITSSFLSDCPPSHCSSLIGSLPGSQYLRHAPHFGPLPWLSFLCLRTASLNYPPDWFPPFTHVFPQMAPFGEAWLDRPVSHCKPPHRPPFTVVFFAYSTYRLATYNWLIYCVYYTCMSAPDPLSPARI